MKKILHFAILMAMTTFLSCSKNEIVNINQKKSEINFNAYTKSSTITKNINTEKFSEFNVYGYTTTNNYLGNSSLEDMYIDNLHVIKDPTTNLWTNTNKYYWPTNNDKLHFFAISPLNTSVKNYQTSTDSYPSFDYTIEEKGDNQKDLIVSSLLNQTKPERDGNIYLEFKHALSQINFSLKGEENDFKYTITNIEIQNIKDKGKFTFNEEKETGTWRNQSGKTNYSHNLSDFVINGTTIKSVINNDKTFILMPQEDTRDAKIKVTYSVKEESTNNITFKGSKEVELSALTWVKNKKINYILTLPTNEKKITYQTEINNWETKIKTGITTLKLNKKELTIVETKTEKLESELIPFDPNKKITWSSSNKAVATVNGKGMVTGISIGKAVITGKVENTKGTCNVTITDIIPIANKSFKSLLLKNKKINTNADKNISLKEAVAYKGVINIDNKTEITTIKGIRYFENLTEFSCAKSGVKSLNFSENLALKKLNCSNTKIKYLIIDNNKNLEYLDCYNTPLFSFNTTLHSELKYINCANTNICEIPTEFCRKLTYLNCCSNHIFSLHLKNNKELRYLDCSHTALKALNVTYCTKLVELNFSYPDLITPTQHKNKSSDILYRYIEPDEYVTLNLNKNTKLEKLNCEELNIITLDLRKNLELTDLSCMGSSIKHLKISKNKKLVNLHCGNTAIETLDLSQNIEIARLNFSGTNIKSIDLTKSTNLVELHCSNTKMSYVDISKNRKLKKFNGSGGGNLFTIFVWKNFNKKNFDYFMTMVGAVCKER
ncbi:MAG: fimbrillin family protein [Bacteroidetes bacterium]|nr:fimbrillin family protein [Bacteroidota bacterium]